MRTNRANSKAIGTKTVANQASKSPETIETSKTQEDSMLISNNSSIQIGKRARPMTAKLQQMAVSKDEY